MAYGKSKGASTHKRSTQSYQAGVAKGGAGRSVTAGPGRFASRVTANKSGKKK